MLSLCVMLLIFVFLFCVMLIAADCCYLLPSLYCQLNILHSCPMCCLTNVDVGFYCFLFYLFIKTQKKGTEARGSPGIPCLVFFTNVFYAFF